MNVVVDQSESKSDEGAKLWALCLLIPFAVVVVAYSVRVFDLRNKDYGEGPMLSVVVRMLNEPISSQWRAGPVYTLAPYGPGYYTATKWTAQLTGYRRSVIPGRIVALVAAVATAVLIAVAVRRAGTDWGVAIAGGMAYLASPTVWHWVPYQRVDSLAVLFSVAAYLAIVRPRTGLVWSAVAIVVGSLVKQTVALTAFPLFVWLLFARRFRDAGIYTLLVGGLGIGAWLVLNWATEGFFLAGGVRGNLNALHFSQGFAIGYEFLATPLGVAACAALVYLAVTNMKQLADSPYCVGFVVTTLLSVVLAGKEGASKNYFLESAGLAAIVLGIHGLGLLASIHPRRAAIVVGLVCIAMTAPSVDYLRANWRPVTSGKAAELPEVLPPPESEDRALVLTDGNTVDAALAAGYFPVVNDSFLLRMGLDNGSLDARPLYEAIDAGRVPWLLLNWSLEEHRRFVGTRDQYWPVETLDVIQSGYEPVGKKRGMYVYRWKNSAP